MNTLAIALVVVLVIAAAIVLAAVLPEWRRVTARRLPVWRFLDKSNAAPEGAAALAAAVRCDMCASQEQCRKILAAGGVRPAPGCPNAALFGVRT